MKSLNSILLSFLVVGFAPASFTQTNEVTTTNETAVERPDEQLSVPAREVIKLADAQTEKSAIEAYINNSAQAFQLTADNVIYLRDLGIDTELITAMLHRDVQLSGTATTNVPSEEVTIPATNAVAEAATAPLVPADESNVTQDVSTFYDALAPYGSWVYIANSGWAWQPNVVVTDPGWRPYCDGGHWLWSDCGWYWSSDYSWGWAPFHYGRWWNSPGWGWVWCPDRTWGPSWVTWRTYGNYCGWAPLPPHSFFIGTGFTFNGGFVGFNFGFGLTSSCFTFVNASHFHHHDFRHNQVSHHQVNQFFNNSTVVNNFTRTQNNVAVNNGVPVNNVRNQTGRPFRQVPVMDSAHLADFQRRTTEQTRHGETVAVTRAQLPSGRTTATSAQQTFMAQQLANNSTPIVPAVPRRLASARPSTTTSRSVSSSTATQPSTPTRVNPLVPNQSRTISPNERMLWQNSSGEQSLTLPSQRNFRGELPSRSAPSDIREPAGARRTTPSIQSTAPSTESHSVQTPQSSPRPFPRGRSSSEPLLRPVTPTPTPAPLNQRSAPSAIAPSQPIQRTTPQTQTPRSSTFFNSPLQPIHPPTSSRSFAAPAPSSPSTFSAPSRGDVMRSFQSFQSTPHSSGSFGGRSMQAPSAPMSHGLSFPSAAPSAGSMGRGSASSSSGGGGGHGHGGKGP